MRRLLSAFLFAGIIALFPSPDALTDDSAWDPLELSPPFHIGGNVFCGPQPFAEIEPELTFDGTNYFAAWTSQDHIGEHVCGARVSPSGVVLDSLAIRIYSSPQRLSSVALASSWDGYLVVWVEWCIGYGCPDIYGARVSKSGFVLDREPIVISGALGYQMSPQVASDGTDYLVVWSDTRDGDDYKIYAARVSSSGEVLDPEGFRLSPLSGMHTFPDIEFYGTNYMVIWGGAPGVRGTGVSPDGTVLNPGGIPMAGPGGKGFPALAFDGTNFMITWTESKNPNWGQHDVDDVYCCIVSPTGEIIHDDIAVSTIGYTKYYIAVDFDGENYMILWGDERDYERDVYAARVTTSGVVLDTEAIQITSDSKDQMAEDIAFDGTNYLAIWQDNESPTSNVRGARIAPSGEILDPDGVTISMDANWQLSPVASSDGDGYLAAWTDHRGGKPQTRATRVTALGEVLDPDGIEISTDAGLSSAPATGFDGTNYLVAWAGGGTGRVDTDICLARVTTSGEVLDPNGFCLSADYYEQKDPDIAFDGENYLVVWGHRRYSWDPMPTLVKGARVSPSGEVLDSRFIDVSGSDHSDRPAVAFDGTNYLVVWGTPTIQGTRVSPDGAVLDPHLPAVAPAGYWQQFPAIAFDGSNYFVVWMDKRPRQSGIGEQFDVLGVRVDPSLNRLDDEAIVISTLAGDQRYPSIVFDGSDYVITWMDWHTGEQTVRGNIVTPDGEVLYPEGFPILAGGENPSTPALALGAEGQVILAYSAFTPGPPYNCPRIWANMLGLVPVPATVDLDPDVLNVKSKGKYVTCYIELPEAYDPNEIEVGTVMLNSALTAVPRPSDVGDYDNDGVPDRMVKFSRGDLVALIEGVESDVSTSEGRGTAASVYDGGQYAVVISGELADGTRFSGADLITVKDPGGGTSGGGSGAGLKVSRTLVRGTANVSYELAVAGPVSLQVFDAAGRLVRTVEAGFRGVGTHRVAWDGRTDEGLEVGSGVYFIRLEHGGKVSVRKLLVLD